jgi:DNA-binding beta-propeller fold protein YncE
VNPHRARRSPAAKTGLHAALRCLLGIGGSSAPSSGGVGVGGRTSLLGLAALTALALTALLAVTATPASALVTHEFESRIVTEVPAGSGAASIGPIVEPQALSVDGGALYVADGGAGTGRVDKFDAGSGAWLAQFEAVPALTFLRQGVAVGHSTGETETYLGADLAGTSEGAVAVFGPLGNRQATWTGADTPAGAFGCLECFGPGDVAVDESTNPLTEGDVYVADSGLGVIDVFEPKSGGGEQYLTQIAEREAGVPLSQTFGVAVDQQSGDVLVLDANGVDVFEPTAPDEYALANRIAETPAGPFHNLGGLTVDAANGDIYIADREPRVIDQFSSVGTYLGHLTGTPAGPFGGPGRSSLAVDPATHRVYVGDGSEGLEFIDVFGPDIVLPDVKTELATEVEPESAVLNGTVDPNEAGIAGCRFLWGTSEAFGEVAPCEPASVPDGNTPVAVHAALPELQPDTTYHFRLQAENANGLNPGEAFQDQHFTTAGPGIRSESVSDLSAESATLEATIDPHGSPTSYFFQFGTDTSYGTEVPVAPGSPLGSGLIALEVSNRLQGLSPATTYHYRVIARSELGPGTFEEFAGPDHTFTTQVATADLTLPDSRAWELVSPPDKRGAALQPLSESGLVQASSSGDAISYLATVPTEASPPGYNLYEQVISSRAAGGWSSKDVNLSHGSPTGPTISQGQDYRFFSEDLSRALVETPGEFTSLAPEVFPPDTERTPYLRRNSTCAMAPATCYEPLLTRAPGYENVPPGTEFGGPPGPRRSEANFVGATPDLSHVILTSHVALTETPATGNILYEWSTGRPPAEALQLISVLPDGEAAGGVSALGYENSTDKDSVARNAISADGSRVVWSQRSGHLYLRADAAAPQSGSGACDEAGRACTIQLDALQGGSGAGPVEPIFQLASTDGSRVFFTDTQGLTAGASTQAFQPDLYECEIVEDEQGNLSCRLSDLTHLSGENAHVLGLVLGASEDASYVYFVADGVLGDGAAHGARRGDCEQVPGAISTGTCNLYLWHDGTISLVAVLSGEDNPDWGGEAYALSFGGQTSRVSPDGRYLAFMSDRSPTGYDNHDARSGKPDEEVFLYHAAADRGGEGTLVCPSCNPTGARPSGVEYADLNGKLAGGTGIWAETTWIAANIPTWTAFFTSEARYQPRYLSDSGRLFFNAADSLVPQDTNANQDVYQYEPSSGEDVPPADSCALGSSTYGPASRGCVSLISSGTSKDESAFLDASESGNDVFFLTAARLSFRDVDSAFDVYDARVGGGEAAPVKPVECAGDACQQPAVPPDHPTPGTALLNGPGNLLQCPKGKTVKNGKCVKKKQKSKKKNHKKKGKNKKKGSGKKQKRAAGHNGGGHK